MDMFAVETQTIFSSCPDNFYVPYELEEGGYDHTRIHVSLTQQKLKLVHIVGSHIFLRAKDKILNSRYTIPKE